MKTRPFFRYMPYKVAISFPRANNLILAFVLLNFLKNIRVTPHEYTPLPYFSQVSIGNSNLSCLKFLRVG